MHIPDGYLSPQTCVVMGGAMVPVWVTAGRRARAIVKQRHVPLLAIAASYSFLVMMLNVPVPDGTTAHAVGAVLIAILLGPWAAVVCVSVALLIQALFFGDGGVLAFGANAFNMAFVMPFVGYAVYKAVAGSAPITSTRRVVAAGIGSYVGVNVAALLAAIEFGIQPDLFKAADGAPLYAPFHLAQTIPTMMLAHLLVAGVVEAAVAVGVLAYLQRANLPVLRINPANDPARGLDVGSEPGRAPSRWRWAVIGLVGLVVMTPVGLLAPGGAFGEDAPGELALGRYGLQSIPVGLDRYNSFWSHAFLDGYGFGEGQNATLGYLASAAVGVVVIAAVVGLVYGLTRLGRRVGVEA